MTKLELIAAIRASFKKRLEDNIRVGWRREEIIAEFEKSVTDIIRQIFKEQQP